MFRAISEMAVATIVSSLPVNPSSAASSRPRWRALRMSCSDRISRRSSSRIRPPPHVTIEDAQPLLQIQRSGHAIESKAELDHSEGNLRLQANDHGLGTPELADVGHVEKRSNGEGIHDFGCRDVHDNSPGTQLPNLPRQVILETHEVSVCERGLDRRDQVVAELEDGDGHGWPPE